MANGKLIGKDITPTAEVSPNGIWNLVDQYVYGRRAVWPVAVSNLLSISPSLNGESSWDGSTPLSFDSTGEYTITPTYDTTVDVKIWGGGGACGYRYQDGITSTSQQGPGGGGGYSTARITLRAGFSYVLQIGEGGIRTTASSSGATYLAGGIGRPEGGTQGGGYSGIFKSSVSQAAALLMAGGGGGGSDTLFGTAGGAGGGSSGQNTSDAGNQGGFGGDQSSGGSPAAFNNTTAGSALLGGRGQTARTHASLGGGGGGYFGGGGGNAGGGGGGSGRIGTDADVSNGVTATGSSSTPANSSDSDRGGAGQGGVAGSTSGTDGKIILTLV